MSEIALLCARPAATCVLAAAMLEICSSVENDAIWPIIAPLSMGWDGSWCCIWATKSLRKSFLSRFAPGLWALDWVLGDGVVEALMGVGMGLSSFRRGR